MRKIITLGMLIALLLPVLLSSSVNYLSYEDYKKLKKPERERYLENLENELINNQQRKADGIAESERHQKRIDELKGDIKVVDDEYAEVHARIMSKLGMTDADIPTVQAKVDYFNDKINNWNDLSDDELWNAKRDIKNLVAEFNEYQDTKYAKIPDFRDDFSDLNRKIAALEMNLENARPKYYEEEYTVKKGDGLAKISGYDFIYGDPAKWGIIYRANRDKIKDPNVLSINQVINIPRGLPNSWKVYKGEFLWKIASYPEVYGSGAKWPLIYRANKDQIKDPNLIYPNQKLQIPRD